MFFRCLAAITLILALSACSSNNTTASPSEQNSAKARDTAPEYETGRTAFQKLYVSARSFAPDVLPYRLESVYTKESPVQQGKAGIWRAGFASPSKRQVKGYTWTGLSGAGMPDRGISHSTEDTYNPNNASTQVFEFTRLKIDTDQAFAVGQKHGGEKLTRKDPSQPVVFLLDFDPKGYQLTWHVIYGASSRGDAKLRVAVDATTGEYKKIEH